MGLHCVLWVSLMSRPAIVPRNYQIQNIMQLHHILWVSVMGFTPFPRNPRRHRRRSSLKIAAL